MDASGNNTSDLVTRIDFNTNGGATVATTIRSFETNRDLIASVENKWGSTQVSKYTYVNDELGRRTSVVTTGSAFSPSRFTVFGYDTRNELTSSKRYTGTDPSTQAIPANEVSGQQYSYAFDCIGNRTNDTGDPVLNTTTYASNNLNEYTSTASPTETFSYDDDGNLTQDGSRTYSWDAENRLTGTSDIILGSKALKIQYKYDYMGRRVRKTTYTASFNGLTWNWNVTPNLDRKFIYDGWNLLLELNALSSDTPVCKYTWGLDLSGLSGNPTTRGLHAAGGIGGLLGMQDLTNTKSYIYCFDANGNVGQLIDSTSGTTGARYELYPYGGELVATGGAATINPFRLSTKYWDGTANLLHFGYRYLKPKMGRWLNRDPIGERGGPCIYAYVANAPSNRFDPLGLQPAASAPAAYARPPFTVCGTFVICPRTDVQVDQFHPIGAYMSTAAVIGFEVIFYDTLKGSPLEGLNIPKHIDCCKTCKGQTRLVQAIRWLGGGLGLQNRSPVIDNAKGWKKGASGVAPPGMTDKGAPGDNLYHDRVGTINDGAWPSYDDAPFLDSSGAVAKLEVCAFCKSTITGGDIGLGCARFNFDSGNISGKSITGRGVDMMKNHRAIPISSGKLNGCFAITGWDSTDVFDQALDDWINHY